MRVVGQYKNEDIWLTGMKTSILKDYINALGEKLVQCNEACVGIVRDQKRGVVPRGMILEDSEDEKSDGCIISGINPGISKKKEMDQYIENGIKYETTMKIWSDGIKNVSYYRKLRKLIRDLGYLGPILWTDLAKCQSIKEKTYPPAQTFRTCCNKFLTREITVLPGIEHWDIIAIGREPFTALSYLYPHRTVIGISHPAAFGEFNKINKKAGWIKYRLRGFKNKSVWIKDLIK